MRSVPPPLIELRRRSKEFANVALPPPAKAIARTVAHGHEIAFAEEIVVWVMVLFEEMLKSAEVEPPEHVKVVIGNVAPLPNWIV